MKPEDPMMGRGSGILLLAQSPDMRVSRVMLNRIPPVAAYQILQTFRPVLTAAFDAD
ncbi:MAG: hypothetical protein AB7L09_21755 [Nitrospira sp.]